MPSDTTASAPSQDLIDSINTFADSNGDYYAKEFIKIQHASGFPISFNLMAGLLGPVWAASRGLWSRRCRHQMPKRLADTSATPMRNICCPSTSACAYSPRVVTRSVR